MPPYTPYLIPLSSSLTLLSSIATIASKLTSSTSYQEATCYEECKHSVAMFEDVPGEFLVLGIYPATLGLDATTLVAVAAYVALVVSFGIVIASAVIWRRGGKGFTVRNNM
jgi:hypothetical protein